MFRIRLACACVCSAVALATAAAAQPTAADAVLQLIVARQFAAAESTAIARLGARGPATARGDSLERLALLDALVEARWKGGRVHGGDALPSAQEAVALATALEPDGVTLARSLTGLGQVHRVRGEYERALDPLRRALAVRRARLGGDDPLVANSLNNLAIVADQMGDVDQALPLYHEALRIREATLGPAHPQVARLLSNIAIAYDRRGDYLRARESYERALRVLEEAHASADDPDRVNTQNNLVLLLLSMGDATRARVLLERVVAADARRADSTHPDVALHWNNLGLALHATGDTVAARQAFERSLAMARSFAGHDGVEVAATLTNLAELELGLQHATAARLLSEQALAIRRRSLDSMHPDIASNMHILARAAFAAGDDRTAEAYADSACALRIHAVGDDHPSVAATRVTAAAARLARGNDVRALDDALRAESGARVHMQAVARGLTERQALAFARVRASGIGVALRAAEHRHDHAAAARAWTAVAGARALVLDEMVQRQRAIVAEEDSLARALADSVAIMRARVATLVLRGEARQREARILLEGLEQRVAVRSASFRRARERERVTREDAVRSLGPGEALLAYVQYTAPRPANDVHYAAFTCEAGGANVTLTPLGPAATIDTLVAQWRREIARAPGMPPFLLDESERTTRAIGERLRRAVWDAVAPALGNAPLVYVVPDGALHLVNILALPSGERYMADEPRAIHMLSAERDLLDARAEVRGTGLFAVGAPAGPDSPAERAPARSAPCASWVHARFAPLPGARKEVDHLASVWRSSADGADARRVTVLTGPDATETAVKRGAHGWRVLHIASHSFVVPALCVGDPALEDSPLLRSGLVCAADRTEDGILTGAEIGALDLTGTEWAVLSACETGGGEVRVGEGVLGLYRAFRVAGARTVVMSLWALDDADARAWMTTAYTARVRDGASTPDAIHRATSDVLATRRTRHASTHPFWWGAMVASGGRD